MSIGNDFRLPEKLFWRPFFFRRTLAAVSLVLEHSCPWPREGLSSERLSLALASDFFCVLGLGLEPCVLNSTSAFFPKVRLRSKKRGYNQKWNTFSPNSGEDQKKGLHQRWNTFFSRIQVDTYAQMHVRVKLLGWCRCRPYLNYWEKYCQNIGGDISPHPSRVLAPLLGTFPRQNHGKEGRPWSVAV